MYENLFFDNDLNPFGLQDAGAKIGKEKMMEMLSKLKDIKIPISLLPELLQTQAENSLPESRILKETNP